ncbi:hypothetical protein HPB50_006319 [Hyalomma asiaticum]|uniref:Uncharacterized protein n=1 Tax=Hyalomma asiaticum TaxID=266040 RepID=A0ACB7TJC6_HYAAI|nr:hypothetical protein HPB50_006319 [Hyalomma asiaticum]
MPDRARKFHSKHHFGRSPKKGRCRKLNGAAAAWREWAPTSPDNAFVSEDASPSMHAVRVSMILSTEECTRWLPLVDYDDIDAISNRGVCVDAFPDSVRDDSGRAKVDVGVISASEVREARALLIQPGPCWWCCMPGDDTPNSDDSTEDTAAVSAEVWSELAEFPGAIDGSTFDKFVSVDDDVAIMGQLQDEDYVADVKVAASAASTRWTTWRRACCRRQRSR